MKSLGWIRYGDKAACGAEVVEACPNVKSHGRELTFYGARLACRKYCVIVQAHPRFTLPNGKNVPHHGHITTGGCPLISTLNDIHGWSNESGVDVPEAYRQNKEGEWVGVFSPRRHEDCEHDQHFIFEDHEGQPLEGISYRVTDERGAVIEGKTCAEGKTAIMAGHEGEALNCDIAKEEE